MKHPKKSFVSVVLAVAMVITCFLLTLCACSPKNPEMLSEPQNFQVENHVITWDPVENASGYLVTLDNKEYRIEENSFNYDFLDIPDTYTFSVIALGDGKKYANSMITYHEIVLEPPVLHGFDELGFEYTYLEKYGGYEVDSGTANLHGMVTIPDYFCDRPVKRIANNMFYDKRLIGSLTDSPDCFSERYCNGFVTGIKLPAYLESIGMRAFSYILYLEEIEIPETVVEIQEEAFRGCKNLKKVNLPKGLKEIPYACFMDTALAEIVLPDSLETIGPSAFATRVTEYHENDLGVGPTYTGHVYSTVSEVIIPDSVRLIAQNAFEGRQNLKTIVICSENPEILGNNCFDDTAWYNSQPDGMVFLGNWLYGYKGEMPENTRIEIPAGTTAVLSRAFHNQDNLQAVVIPEGITYWGAGGTFKNCASLTEVSLPADLKTICSGMFALCVNLKTIHLPEGLIEIGGTAFSYSGLESITIPSTVKKIGEKAFQACDALKEVVIPSGVEFIGDSAFRGCTALETVILPKSIKKIEGFAFPLCKYLTHVFYEGSSFAELKSTFNSDALDERDSWTALPIYYYSETAPTKEGLFWHYVDGKPTPWKFEE